MSRFNVPTVKTAATTNMAGGAAFALNPEYELYTLVCNSLLADTYYEASSAQLARLVDLVKKCDPAYVSNLASYARNEMNLRTIPLVLAGILTQVTGGAVARRTIGRVCKRVDEITELLAFYGSTNVKAINKGGPHPVTKHIAKRPNSLVRGIRDVFQSGRFDEYQYAKYDRRGRMFSIRDALFLTHPKPADEEQAALFKKIANKNLGTPYTWEVELSKARTDEEKLATWHALVFSGRLGHMALLRNLRNILQLKPSDILLQKVLEELKRGVPKGKQFPFRYWSAYRELVEFNMYSRQPSPRDKMDPLQLRAVSLALDECLRMSIAHMPQLSGRNLVACDVSGSMRRALSAKSKIERYDVGLVLGLSLYAANPMTLFGVFGDDFRLIEPSGRPLSDICQMHTHSNMVGFGTHGYKVIEQMLARDFRVDNLLVFTDCQVYGGDMDALWLKYLQKHPNARLFVIDLAGHGTAPVRVNNKNTFLIAGWNDRIFEMCDRLTKAEDAIKSIKEYAA